MQDIFIILKGEFAAIQTIHNGDDKNEQQRKGNAKARDFLNSQEERYLK